MSVYNSFFKPFDKLKPKNVTPANRIYFYKNNKPIVFPPVKGVNSGRSIFASGSYLGAKNPYYSPEKIFNPERASRVRSLATSYSSRPLPHDSSEIKSKGRSSRARNNLPAKSPIPFRGVGGKSRRLGKALPSIISPCPTKDDVRFYDHLAKKGAGKNRRVDTDPSAKVKTGASLLGKFSFSKGARRSVSLTKHQKLLTYNDGFLRFYARAILNFYRKDLARQLRSSVSGKYSRRRLKSAVKSFYLSVERVVFRAFFNTNDYKWWRRAGEKRVFSTYSFFFRHKIGAKLMRFLFSINRLKFFSILPKIFPSYTRRFLSEFLSSCARHASMKAARRRYALEMAPYKDGADKSAAGALVNKTFFSVYAAVELSRRLFVNKDSPFISASHLLWARQVLEKEVAAQIIGERNYLKFPRFKSLHRTPASLFLFSNSIFWNSLRTVAPVVIQSRPSSIRAARWETFAAVRYFFGCAERETNISLFKKITNVKRKLPFILKRNSKQSFAEMRHKMSNLKPWSVNYGLLSTKKIKFVSWDKRSRQLKTSYQPRFFNSVKRHLLFSSTINKVRARYLNLKVFGKLLNTQFSNYLKFGGVDNFVNSTAANKVHPSLVFFNTTDTKRTVGRSPGVSSFFDGFRAVLHQEYSNFNRENISSTDAFTWFRRTAKMERTTFRSEMKTLSWTVEKNPRSHYSTTFNKFWNLNVYKIDLVGAPRTNNRLWGGLPMTSSSFLGTFESGVDKNFMSFYSCNKFSTIKFANSLLGSTLMSGSAPRSKILSHDALKALARSKKVLNLIKRRSRWFFSDRSASFKRYTNSSVVESTRSLFSDHYQRTAVRIAALYSAPIRRFVLKGLWQFYKFRALFWWVSRNHNTRDRPAHVALPFRLFFNQSVSALALLNLQRVRTAVAGLWSRSADFANNVVNTNKKIPFKKFSLFWFAHLRRFRSGLVSSRGRRVFEKKFKRSNRRTADSFDILPSARGMRSPGLKRTMKALFSLPRLGRLKRNFTKSRKFSKKRLPSDLRTSGKSANPLNPLSLQKNQVAPGALSPNALLPMDLAERYRFLIKKIAPEFRGEDPRFRNTRDDLWRSWAYARSIVPKGLFYREFGDFKTFLKIIERSNFTMNELKRLLNDLLEAKNNFRKGLPVASVRRLFKSSPRTPAKTPAPKRRRRGRFLSNFFAPKLIKKMPSAGNGAVLSFFKTFLKSPSSSYFYLRIFTGRLLSLFQISSKAPVKLSKAQLKKNLESHLISRARFIVRRVISRSTGRSLITFNFTSPAARRKQTPRFFPSNENASLVARRWGYNVEMMRSYRKRRALSKLWNSLAGFLDPKLRPCKEYFVKVLCKNALGDISGSAYLKKKIKSNRWFSYLQRGLKQKTFFSSIKEDAFESHRLFWNSSSDELAKLPASDKYDFFIRHRGHSEAPKLKFNPKKFFKNRLSKASGYFFSRFVLGDFFAQQLSEIKKYAALNIEYRQALRKNLSNIFRTAKTLTLFKMDVEAKGRSIFIYYPQKRSWIQRRWNRPYKLISAVSDPIPLNFDEKIVAAKSIYGLRRFFNARSNARGKHWRLKVFIKHILRRKFNCSMSALKTRWRIAKETKRKWYKYFDEFESKLSNILCLMGYYGDLDEAADAILGGIIKINNIVCINPSYKVKVMDVVSVDMQAYVDIRSERVADIVQEYFSTSDVSHEVKRRILGQAADFVKKHAAVARLRREGFSISRYVYFQKLLRAVVTKFNAINNSSFSSTKNNKKKKRPFSKKPKVRSFLKKSKKSRPLENRYSLADLGAGTNFEKITIREAPTAVSKLYSPSRLRRMIYRALHDDVAGLSSSIEISNDIFYKYNNISIYLRRPHTINEMFETSSVALTSTYNPYVIKEFYTSRFEK